MSFAGGETAGRPLNTASGAVVVGARGPARAGDNDAIPIPAPSRRTAGMWKKRFIDIDSVLDLPPPPQTPLVPKRLHI
jgi:hypothetical protein